MSWVVFYLQNSVFAELRGSGTFLGRKGWRKWGWWEEADGSLGSCFPHGVEAETGYGAVFCWFRLVGTLFIDFCESSVYFVCFLRTDSFWVQFMRHLLSVTLLNFGLVSWDLEQEFRTETLHEFYFAEQMAFSCSLFRAFYQQSCLYWQSKNIQRAIYIFKEQTVKCEFDLRQ